MASEAEHQEEHHGLQPMQYVKIGALLTAITVVELGVSYWEAVSHMLLPILFVLSGIKFAIVVALFMHLKFDNPLFTRLFLMSFVLGSVVLTMLTALFWSDATLTN